VKDKQHKPGINFLCASPVIVLPLNCFTWGRKSQHSFIDYLDTCAAPAIAEHGVYPLYAGLNAEEIATWKGTLPGILRTALQ